MSFQDRNVDFGGFVLCNNYDKKLRAVLKNIQARKSLWVYVMSGHHVTIFSSQIINKRE